MPSLAASLRIGNANVSSLLKSAATLQREVATFEDDSAKIAYENSGHTDEAYQTYVNYLSQRINTLQSSGSITDLTKAQNMGQEVVTATHGNISYTIQQENMRLMAQGDAGTVAGYQSKMDVIGNQFQRAMAIGDQTLAFSLQNQYYSVSQSMQQAIASANEAATAIAKANETAGATYQGDIIASLKAGMQNLEAASKSQSIQEWNKTAQSWVQQNKATLGSLGVAVSATTQPNYFDIVNAVQGAIYNHTVLQAQAMEPYNAPGAQAKLQEARNLADGTTKISTLGGSLTAQEVQQAAQDPSMFAYDAATGSYAKTAQIGYHYQADASGKSTLVPTYSGIATAGDRNKVFFLNPQQTQIMTNLGLNFSMNPKGTTGDGVQVQATDQTPDWLRGIMGGKNAITNVYTGGNGQLVFRAGSSTGDGFSSYVLANDGTGKYGVLEQTAEGAILNAGGNYGFNSSAAINNMTSLALAAQNALKTSQLGPVKLAADVQRYTQTMKVASAVQSTPLKVTPSTPAVPQLTAVNPQKTASPQTTAPTTAVQKTASPQPAAGASLNTSGSGGIPLGRL